MRERSERESAVVGGASRRVKETVRLSRRAHRKSDGSSRNEKHFSASDCIRETTRECFNNILKNHFCSLIKAPYFFSDFFIDACEFLKKNISMECTADKLKISNFSG